MKKIILFLTLIILSCSSPTKSEANPPSAVEIGNIIYNENQSLVIEWFKSTDNNFSKYTLLSSFEGDLSNPEVLFESTDINTTSYTLNIVGDFYDFPKYFAIRVTNKSGLTTYGQTKTNDEIQKFKIVYDTNGIIQIIEKVSDGGLILGIKGKENINHRSLISKLNNRLGHETTNYLGVNYDPSVNSTTFITEIQELSNGNILASGYNSNSELGFLEVFPPDINNVNIIWSNTYESISSGIGFKVNELDNGDLVTVGKQDFIKLDSYGNLISKKTISSLSENDVLYDIIESNDKSFFYALGTKRQYDNGTNIRRIFLAKLDSEGNMISSNSYGISNQIVDPQGIYSDNSGNYYISYSVQGSASNHRVLTVDNNANQVSDIEIIYDIHPNLSFNEDSFIGMTGSSGDVTTINIHKFDLSGTALETISHTLDRRINLGAIVAYENEFLIGGSLNSSTSQEKVFLIRIDQNGNNSRLNIY